MGTEHNEQKRRNSNTCVLDMPLDSKNPIVEKSSQDYDCNIIDDLQNNVKLPLENEIYELEEISFDDKQDEINKYFFDDEDAPSTSDNCFHVYRSKSCINNKNISLYNAPKQKLKSFNEPISPFKLSSKNFGANHRNKKRPSSIVIDFQKNNMDNKSCNDNQNMAEDFFDGFILDSDTERTTPNIEDIKNLQNCRKKMAIFRDSIDNKSEHSLDESEKIDDIFSEKNKNINEYKKNKIWAKYIRQQKLKSKLSYNMRISKSNFVKKSPTVKGPVCKEFKEFDDDLFILGILESAANDKKLKKITRYTANV